MLARKVGTPVPKDEIYQKVLGRAMQRYDRAIDVHVSSIRHKLAAVYARARADVHDPVRLTHGLFVVLHHDDRIAQVAQALERGDEL